MLTCPDSCDPIDIIVDMSVEILREDGVAGLSLSAIARKVGVVPSALVHRFESRDRVVGMVLMSVANRWENHVCRAWDARQDQLSGLGGLLPTEEERDDLRAWWAACELALATDRAHLIGRVREAELTLVRSSLVMMGHADHVDARAELVLATIEGLRLRALDPKHTLSRAHALDLLQCAARAPVLAA